MPSYRRRLPHIYEIGQPIFLTWCLHNSLPPSRPFLPETVNSGAAFAILDRLLDESRTGPCYLRQPEIAEMIVKTLDHHAESLTRFSLHSYVVMPNHVHLLITPHIPLPKLTQALKSYTARQANQILNQTGTPFWQQETYDHFIRDRESFHKIQTYIENNPVKAGLVANPADFPYSSAHRQQTDP